MLGSIWMGGGMNESQPDPHLSGRAQAEDARARVRDLEHEVGRLKLLNQALWELLREKMGVTDAELEARVTEVDLRDGIKDGRMSDVALKCPTCSRVSSSKHWKCLYCGQEFEKPVMG
jgi:hypothetical protein